MDAAFSVERPNPQAIAIDPTARFVYVTNGDFQSNLILGFTIDATTGALTSIGAFPTGGAPQAVTVDPSGRFAYVVYTGPSLSGTIARYTINAGGTLTEVLPPVSVPNTVPVSIAITGF